jgi:hypothetical protein
MKKKKEEEKKKKTYVKKALLLFADVLQSRHPEHPLYSSIRPDTCRDIKQN